MLKIWGRRNAYNLQKVMWLVGELDLAHEHVPAGGAFGLLDTPDFLAMNPHGRVPVIDDGGTVVWESHAILRYLAARYGAGRFWSDDAGRRAQIDGWMDWSQTTLQPTFLTNVFWAFYRTPEAQRDEALIAKGIAACARHMELLDRQLASRSYLCGGDWSLADITAGTALYRYFGIDIDRPAVPHVEAWYARLRERPAYREHVMVPFDDLYGRLDF